VRNVIPEPLAGCTVLPIAARRVLNVEPGRVTLRVLTDYTGTGSPWVKVLDAGELIAVTEPGDFAIELAPGRYHLTIYVEVEDARGFYQCDGGLDVDVPAPPPPATPPPPAPCQNPNPNEGCP
jgi:hypothetical protein